MLLATLNGRLIRTTSRLIIASVAGLLFAGSAIAQNLGTTFTDLWYTVGEDGWGVTIDHQQNVMFLTFYVYRADRSPYWVTAVLTKVGTTGLGTAPQTFTGNVFEDHGPWFGDPFNSATVVETTVGTATFTASSIYQANLQYSINGVNVTKQITRLPLSNVNYSSQYLGGTYYTRSNCQNPANNGNVYDSGSLTVSQTGTAFELKAEGQTTSCTFTGTYSQVGSIGQVGGNFTCSDGTSGPFTMFAMQWTIMGMTAGLVGNSQFCNFAGLVGGITNQHIAP